MSTEAAPEVTATEQNPVIKDMQTGEAKDIATTENQAAIAPLAGDSANYHGHDGVSKDAADAAPATTEEKVTDTDVKVTATPVTSGTLGYKAPGLINQLRFKKHYFWLGEEAAVPVSELTSYLRGEKPEVAHPTAAWSSQTGKGLLYFTKNSETKEKPTGIINLADSSEIAKEGDKDFSLQLGKHKHTFQASTADERNGWLVALDKEAAAAKESKESVTGSAGYKESLAGLEKPSHSGAATTAAATAGAATTAAAAGGAAAVASKEDETDAKRHVSDDEDKLGAKEKKTKSKSRSVSRNKRQSIFGGLLGKKEEKEETKKEEAATADAFANDPVKADDHVPVAAEPVAAVEAFANDPVKAEEETKTEEGAAAAAAKPTPSPKGTTKSTAAKRQSIFGGLFQKSSAAEKPEAEAAAPEAAAKDEGFVTPTEENAPVAALTEAAAPIAAVAAGAAGVGAVAATEETKKEETTETAAAAPPAERRRSSFFGLGSKKDKKAAAPAAAATTEDSPAAVATRGITDTDVITNGEVKDEQKTAETTAEKPAAEKAAAEKPATEKKSSKLGDLFRRPSKMAKDAISKKNAATETPAPVTEEAPAAETTAATTVVEPLAPTATDKVAETPLATTGDASIGDVVPDAVTVGESTGPSTVSASA